MNDILTLVARTYDGNNVTSETTRDVFCRIASIGQTEFYASKSTDLKPELKFIIADYLDYADEYLCIYSGQWYRVIRTYRTGQELELVVQRATKEEAGADE